MELEQFYGMNDRGTKRFRQWNLSPANTAGFESASENRTEGGIDLNEQLIHNKPATFFMRVCGDAMTGSGIFNGDVVIVDRSVKPSSGKVVIATLNGDMLIRRLEKTLNKIRLVPDTPKLSPIDVDISGAEFSVWGVVTYVIHAV